MRVTHHRRFHVPARLKSEVLIVNVLLVYVRPLLKFAHADTSLGAT